MDISWKVWAYFSCVRSFHQSISWDWFQVSRGEFSAFCLESSLWPDFGWGPADERRVSKIFPLIPSKARFSAHHTLWLFPLLFFGLSRTFHLSIVKGKLFYVWKLALCSYFLCFWLFFSPLSRVGRTSHLYSNQFFIFPHPRPILVSARWVGDMKFPLGGQVSRANPHPMPIPDHGIHIYYYFFNFEI